MIKVMTSRFDGKCGDCGKGIKAGETIRYNTETRKATHGVTCPVAAEITFTLNPAEIKARIATLETQIKAAEMVIEDSIIERMGSRPPVCPACKGTGEATVSRSITCDWTETFYASGPCGSKFVEGEDPAPYTCYWHVTHPAGLENVKKNPECVKSLDARRQWDHTAGIFREIDKKVYGVNDLYREIARCHNLLTVKRGSKVTTWHGRGHKEVSGIVKWIGYDDDNSKRVGIDTGGEKLTYVPASRCALTEVEIAILPTP